MTDTPTDRKSVDQALAELDDVVRCRCHDAYTGRGLRDPDCQCDSADAVAIVRAALEEAEARAKKLGRELNAARYGRPHFGAQVHEAAIEQAAQEAHAVALQEAAEWHREVIEHDQRGLDYASAVGIPIANAADLRASVEIHEYALNRILALIDTPAAEALAERDKRVRAEEREHVLDEVSEKWASAIYGATENGVAWLNDKAARDLGKAYPDLSAFGDWLTDAAIRARGET